MIQSVSRALDILLLVAEGKGEPVTLTQIAQRSKLNMSTAAHLLDTLRQKGYVHQISRSRGYVLGAYAYYMTRYKKFHENLVLTCNPIMRWMQRQLDLPVLLAVLVDNCKFVVSVLDDGQGDFHERGDMFLGKLYESATGRALISQLDHNEIAELVRRVGLPDRELWPEADTLEALQQQARLLGAERVVVVETPDQISFAASLCKEGAIGVPCKRPAGEAVPPERRAEIERIMLRGVREINRRLRFGGEDGEGAASR